MGPRLTSIAVALCATLWAATPAFAAEAERNAAKIVERVDNIRFPTSDYQVDISIESRDADGDSDARKYRVLSKGKEDSVVLTMEPASERGQAMLMKGRDLWVFLPRVSQPVRLSLSQRLTGQVANGDLARANFSGDYEASLTGIESIGERQAEVLELKAKGRGVTYARVKLWVDAELGRPMKAEFYSLSGRLLKTCSYEDYREIAGEVRPTRLVMTDALKQGQVSVLTYEEMLLREIPARLFTKEYLKKLQ
ncbi:MAG: outer membrane lipoprotein-sorting protein [Rhodocyclaceae bacterium]|nr:outer membrane lipoprotein-sorting protein [Rhodocyclaceae bacterium]